MKCIHCGKEIRDSSKFCPFCGKKINAYSSTIPLPLVANNSNNELIPVASAKVDKPTIKEKNLSNAKNPLVKHLYELLNLSKNDIVNNNSTFYWLEYLNQTQIDNILKRFEGSFDKNDIIAFIDTSMKNNGKTGLVFLSFGFSYKEFMQDPLFVRYDKMDHCVASNRNKKNEISEITIYTNEKDYTFSPCFINLYILLSIFKELVNYQKTGKKYIEFDSTNLNENIQEFSLFTSDLSQLENKEFKDIFNGFKKDVKISKVKLTAFLIDFFNISSIEAEAFAYCLDKDKEDEVLYKELEIYFNNWKEIKHNTQKYIEMHNKYEEEYKELKLLDGKFEQDVTYIGGHPSITKQGYASFELVDDILFIKVGMFQSVGQIKLEEIRMIRFETKKEISSRITLTRLLFLGSLGLFLKKVESEKYYFLTIECSEYVVCFSDSNFKKLQSIYKRIYDYWKLYEQFNKNYIETSNNIESTDEIQNTQLNDNDLSVLNTLKNLFDSGVITEDEFKSKKKQILKL